MNQKQVTIFLITTVIFIRSVVGSASVESSTSCTLPNCDLTAALEVLSKSNQRDRSKILSDLINVSESSDSISNLNNLYDYSIAAQKLLREAKEENWLILSAVHLMNLVTERIASSLPLNETESQIMWFDRLADEAARSRIIGILVSKIRATESVSELRSSVQLLTALETICVKNDDDEYLIVELKRAGNSTKNRLYRIYPIYEGIYQVKATCKSYFEDPRCSRQAKMIDRITVIDPINPDSLFSAYVSSQRLKINLFQFPVSTLTIHPSTSEATISANSNSTELVRIEITSPALGDRIFGTLSTPEYEITFEGLRVSSSNSSKIFLGKINSPQSFGLNWINNSWTGTIDNLPISARFSLFPDGRVGGSVTLTQFPNIKFRIANSEVFEKLGIISAIGYFQTGGTPVRLILSLEASETGEQLLHGVLINSQSGTSQIIRLQTQNNTRN